MIGQLIALLFLSRDVAHRSHLAQTGPGSNARHMALGSFYDAIIGLADDLSETYQGRYGLIERIDFLDAANDGAIDAQLASQLAWIEANRYDAIPANDTALQNIVDEIVACYLRTLYKLRNLA